MKREFDITDYMPSHKQHSLNPDITPEQLIEKLGKPAVHREGNDYESGGEKVTWEWRFFAREWREGEGFTAVHPCAIWDFKGSRWSAFGPREVFEQLNLLP
jgi:hypothetical protein